MNLSDYINRMFSAEKGPQLLLITDKNYRIVLWITRKPS